MISKAAVQEVAASKDPSLPSNLGSAPSIHSSFSSASFLSFISSPLMLLGDKLLTCLIL